MHIQVNLQKSEQSWPQLKLSFKWQMFRDTFEHFPCFHGMVCTAYVHFFNELLSLSWQHYNTVQIQLQLFTDKSCEMLIFVMSLASGELS